MGLNFTKGTETAKLYGTHEICLLAESVFENPYYLVEFGVLFTRPDGSQVKVDGFYDGGDSFKARAYCNMPGKWEWKSISNHKDLAGKAGSFMVIPSNLKGKLKIHREDARQFSYENGEWFLHIGDTAYRYLVDSEPHWKEYLDQAASCGFTKIRTWLCRGRNQVDSFFQDFMRGDRQFLSLSLWQEADRRLIHALNQYPDIMFQIVLYGEDDLELARYAGGDPSSKLIAKYAQARFSALANVQWCISNDLKFEATEKVNVETIGKDKADAAAVREGICRIGKDMAAREPWGTLITNHQARFSGYSFVDEPWSDIITLEDLGQVTGAKVLEFRKKGSCPVVLEEDRYETWRSPKHDRYFFRRYM